MVFNEKLREIKIGITTIVAAKWIFEITRKIGEGAFGMVFECFSIAKPSVKRALKAEIIGIDASHESLKMEIYVMRKMMSVNSAHSVQLLGAGTERNFNYVVMTLLGLSLSDIRKRLPDEKFSLDSLIVIGIQSTDSLKELHSAGFVHRDIKPSNYTVGKEEAYWIYLIDFGICREIMYTEDLQTKLKCPRRNCQFRGTTRYCSINAHKRKELGRHDDLISMMYMLLEGHSGALPWKHKDRVQTEKLKSEKEEEMLAEAPKPFARVFEYLRELTYFISPDYKRVRHEFVQMAEERKLAPPYKLDWDTFVVSQFEKANPPGGTASTPKALGKDQLMNPPDINTLYDVPDEFPHEESCSDSDRTIPSTQEQRPPSVYRTEEKTQSDEQGSMMQGVKGKRGSKKGSEKSTMTSPYLLLDKKADVPKTEKKTETKTEKKESNKDEKKEEKKEEKREDKKEKPVEKKEEPKKAKDESGKSKAVKKDDSSKKKVKAEKAQEAHAVRTPALATAPTPATTTPATAAAAVAAATTPKKIEAAKEKVAKEIHVDDLKPLKKTECSMRRKERSEMRKKRREARGGAKSPLKPAPKARTPMKSSIKKSQAVADSKKKDLFKRDSSNKGHKLNFSAEKTCPDYDDVPAGKDKKKKRASLSRDDASDKMCRKENAAVTPKRVKDENTQISCIQNVTCIQTLTPPAGPSAGLSREPLSGGNQPQVKSRQRTDHTLSSKRETGKLPKTTKGTRRVVHGSGSKEDATKEEGKEAKKPKNPPSKGARSRASKHHRNQNEERTVEASELKEKKEKKGGTLERLSRMVRGPPSKAPRKKNQPPSDTGNKTDTSVKKTGPDEPENIPTIPKAPGARSISKMKKPKRKSGSGKETGGWWVD